jgi:hypothetical protein
MCIMPNTDVKVEKIIWVVNEMFWYFGTNGPPFLKYICIVYTFGCGLRLEPLNWLHVCGPWCVMKRKQINKVGCFWYPMCFVCVVAECWWR